ncbi:MAG: biotin--[acetyl-CoA-carboxylase] ligase [Candidatus Rokuibacteriota bacterium]|nr:MAG: biotin--[acetyl-CoA-carboxylase] ligase [Candidatus Rokubacteria bacterium]
MARDKAEPAIVRLDQVDSTQTVAFALAERGATDRTVVVADQQAAGRGRRGRVWQAPARTSLLASILVRSGLPQALLATLSPTTAVATAEALRRVAPLEPRLKWPNDVLVGGRKIAGILLESRAVASSEPVLVIGVGINLGQREFPPELAGRATSVALETGHAVDRETMLAALLEEFDAWRARLEGEGFGPVRERWKSLSDTIGRHVTVDGVSGTATDLDGDGALLIDVGDGVRRVIAGEITTDETTGEAHAARR